VSWTCPECGRSFANANQWHSCGRYELEDHFAGKSIDQVAVYQAIEEAVLACGPCEVQPAKTAILIRRRVTFMAVKIRTRWVDVGIRMQGDLESERVRESFQFSRGLFEHRFRLTALDEVDDEFRSWICRGWSESG